MGLELLLPGANGAVFRTNPDRDIAHFWPQIIEMAGHGLARINWEPWYLPLCEMLHIHEGHLFRARAAFQAAMELAAQPDVNTPMQALEIAGFLAEPWAAQLVMIGKIGQLGTGAFWAGYKSAFHINEREATLESMARHARHTRERLDKIWGVAG
jgi:hypothetical protein